MTYIEFFEKDAIENICSSLIRPADTVILVGSQPAQLTQHKLRYEKVLASQGKQVHVTYRQVNRNSLEKAVEELSYIVENYEDCIFDLTGGEDLYLVAMGIVFEKYKDKNIQMHRFNIQSNMLYDCDQDGATVREEQAPDLSVEDNIALYGGEIRYGSDVDETYCWQWDDEFEQDVRGLWEICRKDHRTWNALTGVLIKMARNDAPHKLVSSAATMSVQMDVSAANRSEKVFYSFLEELRHMGALSSVQYGETALTLTYKNEQIKRCLMKEGQILELWIYLVSYWASAAGRGYIYNDVQTGVVIDWDGDDELPEGAGKLTNEVDVMMMHGCVPVFVSCKNGNVEVEELYKLNTVAERFGGKHAKKALVISDVSRRGTKLWNTRQRATEMGIRVVDRVAHLTPQALEEELSTLWKG